MDLTLSSTLAEVDSVVGRLLDKMAGPLRARELLDRGGLRDAELLDALEHRLGWSELIGGSEPDQLLAQVLIAERCGSAVAQLDVAALVTGSKLERGSARPIAHLGGAVRRPNDLRWAIAVDRNGSVQLHSVVSAADARIGWGEPWGRVTFGARVAMDADSAHALIWEHRLIVAAEGVGAARRALAMVLEHVCQRELFGAVLAARQAVRHALAEMHADVEATGLLVREAAAAGAPASQVSMALDMLLATTRRLVPDLHRFVGALGMSREYDLHVFTGRLRSVAFELGGSERWALDVAASRKELRR